MKVYEIKKYGVFRDTITNGTDDHQISMDGLTHSYDTALMNRGSTGLIIALRLEDRAGYDHDFELNANETISLTDWDIVGIRVSNKSGTDNYLQILMGGE